MWRDIGKKALVAIGLLAAVGLCGCGMTKTCEEMPAPAKPSGPSLRLSQQAPPEAEIGDPIPVKLLVTNVGQTKATNVKVNAKVPMHVMTKDGQHSATFDAGTLGAGQSKEFAMELKTDKTGPFDCDGTTTGDGGLKADAVTTTVVKAAPMVAPTRTGACPVVTRGGGMVSAAYAMPTGNPASSVVLLEKTSIEEVSIDQTFTYDVKVTNLTDCPLDDVTVTDDVPKSLAYMGADPKHSAMDGRRVRWDLGTIDGKKSKVIKVRAVAKSKGTFIHCADVAYKQNVCITIKAVKPGLSLVQQAPSEVLICDPVPVKVVVTNAGTGKATNVKVKATLPRHVVTKEGRNSKTFDAGTLAEGQSKEFAMQLKAGKAGPFAAKAVATGDGDLTAQASTPTAVKEPVLTIAKTGSRKQMFVRQSLTYSIEVTNKGDWVADKTVVKDTLPDEVTVKSASDRGQVVGKTVTWNLGSIKPNQSRKVNVTVRADTIGTLRNAVTAEAECCKKASAVLTTPVKGIPAILLEVVDLEDPIEVGDNETYVITATNQGSAPGTNIVIKCVLEGNAQYISSSGTTTGRAAAQTVTFAPLASLAPKDKAAWKVVVKAMKAGDVRFKVQMTSDQISRPVDETEATNFYE